MDPLVNRYELKHLNTVLSTVVERLSVQDPSNPAISNFESLYEHYKACSKDLDRTCLDGASDQMALILAKTDGINTPLFELATVIALDAIEAMKFALEGDSVSSHESIGFALGHFSQLP